MKHLIVIVMLIAACASASCKKAPASSNATPPAAPAWVLATAPASHVSVVDGKATAAEGDTIAVRGRIGGRVQPITPGTGIFLIVDTSVPYCGQLTKDDHCATPWDYCCETPESLTATSATVALVDAQGAPLAADLAAAGFNPLDEVIAVGVVQARPTPEVLIVKATQLHRVGR